MPDVFTVFLNKDDNNDDDESFSSLCTKLGWKKSVIFFKNSFKSIREILSDQRQRETCLAWKRSPMQRKFLLQCDYLIRAPWKIVNQSERFLRTKDSEIFLK